MLNLPFFEGVPPELIQEIEQKSEERFVAANNFVCREEEIGTEMYIVLDGELLVYKNIEGKPTQLNSLTPGDFFCETSLITHAPRNASVITSKDSKLFVISKAIFEKVFGKYPEISEKISRAIIDRSDINTLKEIQVKREKYKNQNPDESSGDPLTISI